MATTGVAFTSRATFSQSSGSRTTIGIIPPGDYGINPTVAVVGAGKAGTGTTVAWFESHTPDILLSDNSQWRFPDMFLGSAGGVPSYGGTAWWGTVAGSQLNTGGIIRMQTTQTVFGGDAGVTVAAVISYADADRRDTRSHFARVVDLTVSGDPWEGDFVADPVTIDVLTQNGSTYDYELVGDYDSGQEVLDFDPTVTLALGVAGFGVPVGAPFVPVLSWEGADNWTNVVRENVTGYGTVAIGLWRKPEGAFTGEFSLSAEGVLGFLNGARAVLMLNNSPLTAAGTSAQAQVVG